MEYTSSTQIVFRNYYACKRCHVEWETVWDSMCEDECPKCEKPFTPVRSEELTEAE